MKNFAKYGILATLSMIISTTSFGNSVAIGPKVGTQGIGIEARGQVADNTYIRLGANYFKYSKNYDDGSMNYKGNLTLLSAPLMLDYHPFDNSGFRVSVGVAYNGNKVDIKASSNKMARIKGTAYTPNEIGNVKGKLKLGNPVAGLLTFGYDSSLIEQRSLNLAFEAGIMYTGQAKLTMSADGLLSQDKQFMSNLKSDANSSFKTIKNYLKVFPIISIGLKYSF